MGEKQGWESQEKAENGLGRNTNVQEWLNQRDQGSDLMCVVGQKEKCQTSDQDSGVNLGGIGNAGSNLV